MKISGKFLKVLIPYKIYKLIANGFIVVPKYYKEILTETERYFDLSLEDHIYKDLMLMRKFGHIIDKGLHRTDASPGHSKNYYDALKQLIKKNIMCWKCFLILLAICIWDMSVITPSVM